MTLAATDRYRLAVRELAWSPSPGTGDATVLVPARTLADAARMMTPGEPVRIMLRASGTPDERGRDDRLRGRRAGGSPPGCWPASSSGTGPGSPTSSAPPRTCPPRRSPRRCAGCRSSPSAARRSSCRSARPGHGRRGHPGSRAGQGDGARRVQRRRAGDRVQPAATCSTGWSRRRRGAEDGRVRLRFTSASKPAVITQSPSGAPGGPGRERLQVPRRPAARAAVARRLKALPGGATW